MRPPDGPGAEPAEPAPAGGESARASTQAAVRTAAFPAEDPATLKPPQALLPLLLELCGTGCPSHGAVIDADPWLAAHPARR